MLLEETLAAEKSAPDDKLFLQKEPNRSTYTFIVDHCGELAVYNRSRGGWVLRVLLIVVLVVSAGLYVLFNFSSSKEDHICNGIVRLPGIPDRSETLFFTYEKYAPWVGLWSDSDGSVWIEGKIFPTSFYPNVDANDRFFSVYDFDGTYVGEYSLLRDHFTVKVGEFSFSGDCRRKSPCSAPQGWSTGFVSPAVFT
ncbi:hypothetical protein [Hyphomonas sp.]|uniref:hypothetical protein n=1 Tax=Hyphomonas sp. TaxID=87 RepID=UPI003528A6EC